MQTFGLLSLFIRGPFLLTLQLADSFDQFIDLDQGVRVVLLELGVEFEHLSALVLLASQLISPNLLILLKLGDCLVPFGATLVKSLRQLSNLLVQFAHDYVFLPGLVLQRDDLRGRVHVDLRRPGELACGTTCSHAAFANLLRAFTEEHVVALLSVKGADYVGVAAGGYGHGTRAAEGLLLAAVTLSTCSIEPRQPGQVHLHRVPVVHKIADRIASFRCITRFLKRELAQMRKLAQLSDVGQFADVVVREVEHFKCGYLCEFAQRHERNYPIVAQVERLEGTCHVCHGENLRDLVA